RIEEIFRSADQMMPEEKSPGGVERPGGVDQKRGDRLARDQQRVAGPKADARQNDGDVAKVQKICCAPGMPVNGEPDQEPKQGAPSKPRGDTLPGWRGHWHCFEELSESGGMVSKGGDKSHRLNRSNSTVPPMCVPRGGARAGRQEWFRGAESQLFLARVGGACENSQR